MKSIFTHLFLAILTLACVPASAQIIIDMSTGVYDGGGLIPPGAADDTWQASQSTTGSYPPVYSTNGIQDNAGGAVVPPGAGPAAHSMFVSPNGNPSGYYTPYLMPGGIGNALWYYKMSFYLWSCPIQTAKMVFKTIGADLTIHAMSINQPVNQSGSPSYNLYMSPLMPGVMNNNITIPINVADIHQGLNEIVFWTVSGDSHTGFQVDGKLIIETCAATNFSLRNDQGVETTEFCMSENVFLQGHGSFPNNEQINLLVNTGSGYTTLASVPTAGLQHGFNVTSVFASALQNANPSNSYKLQLVVNNSCQFDICNPFQFDCCANSLFSLVNNGSMLSGNSAFHGNYTWNIYSFPPGNEGSYTKVASLHERSFQIDAASPCYYVTLDVTSNYCPEICTAQSICNMDCSIEPCILMPPSNLTRNLKGNTLTWGHVTGADHYQIDVAMNDPRCCQETGQITGDPQFYHFTSQTESYALQLPPQGEPLPGFPPVRRCYSITVYAVCADGSRSEPSQYLCVQE